MVASAATFAHFVPKPGSLTRIGGRRSAGFNVSLDTDVTLIEHCPPEAVDRVQYSDEDDLG